MRSVVAAWLLTLFSLANLPVIQSAPPITVAAYWQLVEDTRQALVQMEASPATEIRSQLDELAGEWANVTAVEFPDGRVQQIDSTRLLTDLKTDPPNLQYLISLMDSLLTAHQQYPQNVFTLEDVKPLQTILARPEFQWQEARTLEAPAWLQRIYDAIANLIGRLLFGIGNALYHGRTPLTIAAALFFVFALYFISCNLARNLVRDAQLAAGDGGGDGALTSQGALQRAQTLSNKGDYRNAIRYLYLSSLLVLDERGLLRYDRARTNREYLRSVSEKPELEKPLHNVIDVFDSVWYGFEEVDESTYQSYVAQVESLREKQE